MDKQTILNNIESYRDSALKDSEQFYKNASKASAKKGGEAPLLAPVDVYQSHADRRYEMSKKKFPKGSRAIVLASAKAVIDGEGGEGLAHASKRAKDDIDSLKSNGYGERASIRATQYMEEQFLPAVETVINYTSPDELLNCKEALSALDKMALGVGSMSGYTAAYVRQAYGEQLGQKQGESDPTVRASICRIKSLVGADQMRTAIGVARNIKEQIDNGEHQAGPEDYAIIGRIVAYAN